jgi:hypothetical protein
MALLVCAECSGPVSSTASACPKCGAPPPQSIAHANKQPERKKLFTRGRLIFAAIFWLVLIIFNIDYSEPIEPHSQPIHIQQPIPKIETWSYNEYTDQLTNKLTKSASIKSNNYHVFDSPYRGQTFAVLQIRKHPKYGRDIIFTIDQGQFVCSVYSDCTVSIRFDENPPIEVLVDEPADNSHNIFFLRGYEKLLKKIKSSKKMYISATVFQNGAPVYEFNIENLEF